MHSGESFTGAVHPRADRVGHHPLGRVRGQEGAQEKIVPQATYDKIKGQIIVTQPPAKK
jgi:hypothetical protein